MMTRRFWWAGAVSLIAAVLAFVALAGSAGQRAVAGPGNTIDADNVLVVEPVLIYDVTGGTLAGLVHSRLSVYNNGQVSISRKDFGSPTGAADFTMVPVTRVRQLRADLEAAGASTFGDEMNNVADLPLTTVTFFSKPLPHAQANTFSYWNTFDGPYWPLQQVIDEFIVETFPNF
jgi:hypothetical protein